MPQLHKIKILLMHQIRHNTNHQYHRQFPLFRLAMSLIVAMPQGAFRSGILYPLFTHLVFGIAGGLVAAGILSLTIKKS